MRTVRAFGALVGASVLVVSLALGASAQGGRGCDGDGPRAGDSWGPSAMHGAGSSMMDRGTSMMERRSRSMMAGGSMMPGGMTSMRVASEADYLATMIPHHQEAVAAAEELSRSARPEMRRLGASIVTTQTAEIDRMQAWLTRWYPRVTPPTDYRPMMRDLSGLSGDALDEAFLEDMIPHHMMAVMMSQQVLMRDLATHDSVERFAQTVRGDQHAEILTMRTWLAAWFR